MDELGSDIFYSRGPCWTRGFIRVPSRGRGTIGAGAGEVVDVWQELLKL
uniref:Uncharacterized protein n=1 Tax=Meloidogyne enterolobii TaxID=390850 RepID=A0A6V7WJZ5_MELEN|nr:unnamed protein product [Meloidogyne enterolobii]